jgi:hypothetical protein
VLRDTPQQNRGRRAVLRHPTNSRTTESNNISQRIQARISITSHLSHAINRQVTQNQPLSSYSKPCSLSLITFSDLFFRSIDQLQVLANASNANGGGRHVQSLRKTLIMTTSTSSTRWYRLHRDNATIPQGTMALKVPFSTTKEATRRTLYLLLESSLSRFWVTSVYCMRRTAHHAFFSLAKLVSHRVRSHG